MSEDKRALLKQWLASGKTTPPTAHLSATGIVGDVAGPASQILRITSAASFSCEGVITQAGLRGRPSAGGRTAGGFAPLVSAGQRAAGADDSPEQRSQFPFPGAFVQRKDDEEAVEEIAKEIFSEPFDLVQGPALPGRPASTKRPITMCLSLPFTMPSPMAGLLGVFVQDLCLAYVQGLLGQPEWTSAVVRLLTPLGERPNASFWQPAELEKRCRLLEIQTRWKPAALGLAGGT